MIATLAVENYRSLRSLVVPLTPLTVVTGANGAGKSSLYRALRLGFGGDEFSYAIDFGFPAGICQGAFVLDPEIKRECIWNGPLLRPSAVLCERDNGIVRIRGDSRTWSGPYQIRPYDSMLSEFADPRQAPEVLRVREQVRSWRFYDHIRTDAAAPARASQIGTRTPVMSHDGADVAAALQTIRETGDAAALDQAIDLMGTWQPLDRTWAAEPWWQIAGPAEVVPGTRSID